MRVIPPLTITDAIFTSSTIIERDPAVDPAVWSSGTSYTNTQLVTVVATHKVYAAIGSVSSGGESPEISVTRAVPKWREYGSTNKWAMFDLYRSTKSVYATTPSTVVLTPGIAVNSIAILEVDQVSNITISCSYHNGVTDVVFYTYFMDMVVRATTGWYDYFFGDFASRKASIIFNIPITYPNMKITLTIAGISGMSIGACVIGNSKYMGKLQNGAGVEVVNYSRMIRDVFGQLELVPRRSIPKITGTVVLDKSDLIDIQNTKVLVDAVPAVWSGLDAQVDHPYFEPLIVLGIYKDFSFQFDNHLYPTANFEIEEI